jgi:hypothetical protein
MTLHTKPWFQFAATFVLGVTLGSWQFLSDQSPSSENKTFSLLNVGASSSAVDKSVLENTANIEQLLALKAPQKDASLNAWYQFALSLDSVELGKRFSNSDVTTPLLSWYALIAKHKPAVIYKLYNQGKIGNRKLEHLLRYGFLPYWEQHIDKVEQLLLKNEQAVMSLAINKGEAHARRQVADAFFKLGTSISSNSRRKLQIGLLRFAMKAMKPSELEEVLPILQRGIFDVDPRDIIQLRQTAVFKGKQAELLALIKHYSNGPGYSGRMMSKYLVHAALLGDKSSLQSMIDDAEFNAKQPTNFYCAACGIAMSSDGLLGMPLINASKRGRIVIKTNPDQSGFVLVRTASHNKVAGQ